MNKTLLVIVFLFLFGGIFLYASEAERGDELEIGLLIVGQGDPLFTAWGHIGLVIRNMSDGTYYMYDYGNFSFSEDDFFVNFAFGRLIYLAMKMRALLYEDYILRTDRDLTYYHLNLPPDKKTEMRDFLEWNVQTENSHYLYHHYHDNCSTRIRDIIDKAVDGQLQEKTDFYRNDSFRSLSRRYTEMQYPFGDWITTFLQAGSIDKPITLWEEMFIPEVLGSVLSDFSYINSRGEETSLVSHVEVMHTTDRFAVVPDVFKPVWFRGLVVGMLAALLGALTAVLSLKEGKIAVLWTLFQLLCGIIMGCLGILLMFMMLFTDHEVTYGNWNWLITSPLALLVIPAIIISKKRKKGGAPGFGLILPLFWAALSAMSLTGFILARIPALYQQNSIVFLVFFPVQLLGVLPLVRYFRNRRSN